MANLSWAKSALAERDRLRATLAYAEQQLDLQRYQWSRENGYCVPLRRESFEAILRAVPPEPGSDAVASSVRPDRS